MALKFLLSFLITWIVSGISTDIYKSQQTLHEICCWICTFAGVGVVASALWLIWERL